MYYLRYKYSISFAFIQILLIKFAKLGQKGMSKNTGKNIEIIGAKLHNLKNISLKIPKDKLIVISGVSGSGK